MKKINYIIIILLVILDRIIKKIMVLYNINIIVIQNILSLLYTKNYGIAFGYINGYNKTIIGISIVIILIYISKLKISNKIKENYLICILVGGLSNLFDRIIYGFVIDYISIFSFPIFNISDTLIVIGVILSILEYYKRSINT